MSREEAWVKLGSWHLLRGPHDHFGPYTRCGRNVEALEIHPGFMVGERTCETCLRLASRDAD